MSRLDEREFLARVQRPSRYLGREINAVFKSPRDVDLRVALLFPDLYEVGMSHLGLALLYDILNREDWIWAERAYAPAPDLEAELRGSRQLLGTLESGAPLKDFHLVGVSLQYELGYTNLLNMLELGGIPLLAEERGPTDPVVIGGGPACFNPEPVAPFFDALVLGDGEEVVLELADTIRAWRAARGSRSELWQALEGLAGVYVPAFFTMTFDGAGRLQEINPRGRRVSVQKRLLADLDGIPLSPRPLVPFCQIVHDRLNVEIARGCSRGCRYCQAGMIYRPVRERDPAAVRAWVAAALGATGFEEVSLLTLSPGDYCALPWLLGELMDFLAPQRVAVSLPSLRADTLTPEMVQQIQRVRRTGLTIAPEAGSDRLRRVINKNLPEEKIIASAQQAFGAGWRLLKLYFMIGLPLETPEDLAAIATLARQILKAAPPGPRPKLNLSLSTFIPKPHTPFQWEGQAPLEESRLRLHAAKDRLQARDIQIKWNSAAQSWLEGIFSRGDRRLAEVLLAAHRRGCRLDAWSEHLRLEPWRQAFQDAGVEPDFYLRERQPEEPLPWDHLDAGLSRDFLAGERALAFAAVETPNCRTEGCYDCGICDQTRVAHRLHDRPASLEEPPEEPPLPLQAGAGQPTWYRLSFAKLDEARWLSHLELITAIYRSLRRSGLPLSFSGGYHPLPRVMFHGALPVGVESLCETLDVELAIPDTSCLMVETLNRALPRGLRILHAARLPGAPKPPRPTLALYQVESPEPVFSPQSVQDFLAQEEVRVIKRRPGKERSVDLRPLVQTLEVIDPHHLQLGLRQLDKDNLKVTETIAHIFKLTVPQTQDLQILKMKSV